MNSAGIHRGDVLTNVRVLSTFGKQALSFSVHIIPTIKEHKQTYEWGLSQTIVRADLGEQSSRGFSCKPASESTSPPVL